MEPPFNAGGLQLTLIYVPSIEFEALETKAGAFGADGTSAKITVSIEVYPESPMLLRVFTL